MTSILDKLSSKPIPKKQQQFRILVPIIDKIGTVIIKSVPKEKPESKVKVKKLKKRLVLKVREEERAEIDEELIEIDDKYLKMRMEDY